MKKIKKFVEEHQKEIVIGSCIAGAVIGGFVVHKYMKARTLRLPNGCEMIAWDPKNGKPFGFEEVKTLMDSLKESETQYAVVREQDKYSLIMLTDLRGK